MTTTPTRPRPGPGSLASARLGRAGRGRGRRPATRRSSRRRLLPSPSDPAASPSGSSSGSARRTTRKGKEGLAALTAAMVAEGGTQDADLRADPGEVLPDGREPHGRLPQGGDRLRGRDPPRQPRAPTCRSSTAMLTDAPVRPRGLRAAPQRGARLPHQDPPRRQRRGAGQVDAPGRALPGPPLRPRPTAGRSRA